ncbi:response regulator [Jiangella muralis]|uniref:response regulator n=1 Tax=Jiangella muralis TaxID=702383 RepID=UPI00069D0DB4|nr:response regulator [Jiangella muralis]
MSAPLRTLVVEDEPIAAAAHATYVERVPGFELAAVVPSGREALAVLSREWVDLVLLDMNLPDLHGLDVCRKLRAAGLSTDIMALTAARDLAMVRAAVSLGIVQYVIKPFTFAMLADRLTRYAAYRARTSADSEATSQHEIDRLLGALRAPDLSRLPKGLAEETLDQVVAVLREHDGASAQEVAAALSVSRVTARRYLEHLHDLGRVERAARHGGAGRPELNYRLTPDRR